MPPPLLTAFWPDPEHGDVRARSPFPLVGNAAAARLETYCLLQPPSFQTRVRPVPLHAGEPRCMHSRFAVLAKPRRMFKK